jgi:hypothetical protein
MTLLSNLLIIGGALMVWRADLYRNEAHRKLGDTIFYIRVDKDLASTHQTTMISLETAKNLIYTTPRTSVMYFFPKIHKLDNPGRPIVSVCGCPTELVSSFLDRIMATLVMDLPSYIKDTNHALQVH